MESLFREALTSTVFTFGPLFAALVVAGLVVGVGQAATQINDPAVGFVPRALAGIGVLWALGTWMMDRLAAYLTLAIQRAGNPFG